MRSPRWLLSAVVLIAVDVVVAGQPAPKAQEGVPVLFVGAGATEGYKLTRPTRDFADAFRLTRTDAPAATKLEVTIAVADLLAPYAPATPLTVLVDDQPLKGPVSLPPGGVVVKLSALLPVPATYTSQITVSAPNMKPLVVPLQITRSRTAATVEFKDIDAVPGETGQAIVTRFSLRETSGLKTTFYTPDLSGLSLVVANKRLQASPTGSTTIARITGGQAETLKPNQELQIEPGAMQTFAITLGGLTTAGEYAATLHATSPDGSTVDQAVTLLVRDSPWLAVFFIVLGVAASMWLRWYFQTKRPEIVNSHLALAVLEQLDAIASSADATDDGKSLVRSLRDRVQRAYELIQMGQSDAAIATVNDVKAKRELVFKWVEAAKRVADLGASTIAPPIRKTLDEARLAILQESGTDVAATLKTVEGIPGAIRSALAADYEQALGKIEASLQKRPGGSGHSPEVQTAIAAVERLIGRAKDAYNAGELLKARTLVSIARKQYVLALADELQAGLVAVPLGFESEAEWTQTADEIKRLLAIAKNDADPDRAWREYDEARRVYVTSVLRGLAMEHGQLTRLVNDAKQHSPSDEELKRDSASLKTAGKAITAAQVAVGTDLDVAFEATRHIDQEIRLIRERLAKRSFRMGQTGQRIAEFFQAIGLPSLASIDSPDALADLAVTPNVQLQALKRSFRMWEIVVSVIIAAIAVLVGIKALWFGSNTWGGYADWTTALLWGLGLHQFSFDGISNLTKGFSK